MLCIISHWGDTNRNHDDSHHTPTGPSTIKKYPDGAERWRGRGETGTCAAGGNVTQQSPWETMWPVLKKWTQTHHAAYRRHSQTSTRELKINVHLRLYTTLRGRAVQQSPTPGTIHASHPPRNRVWRRHNGASPGDRKEQTCYDTDESQTCYAKWRKPD